MQIPSAAYAFIFAIVIAYICWHIPHREKIARKLAAQLLAWADSVDYRRDRIAYREKQVNVPIRPLAVMDQQAK